MTDKPIYATITLTQEGNKGKISFNTDFSKVAENAVPLSHEGMAQVVATYLQLSSFQDEEESTINKTFVTSFTLAQDEPEGPVFASLSFNPKVAPSFDQPTSYGLVSVLFNTWLYMVGILNEDGELVDEDQLDLISFDIKENPATIN